MLNLTLLVLVYLLVFHLYLPVFPVRIVEVALHEPQLASVGGCAPVIYLCVPVCAMF